MLYPINTATPRGYILCGETNSNNRLQDEIVKEQRNLSGESSIEEPKDRRGNLGIGGRNAEELSLLI